MRRFLPAFFFIVLVLACWETLVHLLRIPEYLLPPPSAIARRLVNTFADLAAHTVVTAAEAILGFLLGALCGVTLAVLFVRSRTLELAVYPYAIALKTVPIVAIAPLLVVWLGNGLMPKVVVSAVVSFFPIVVNATKGLRSIDPEAFDLLDSMSASPRQVFLKLRIPSALPFVFAALRISSTLAVIGAIVGEFSGADKGLGFFILISSYRLETVDVFAGILLSSCVGIAFFYSVALAERLLVPWAGGRVEEAA